MEWFRRWFGEDYLLVYRHRDEEEAERDIEFAGLALGLARDALVLDLCCGTGRHSRALTRRGYRAVGLDFSGVLLLEALSSGKNEGPPPRYVLGDARALPFREGVFDAVLNLFTSFGYFEHRENCAMLGDIARVLAQDGSFFIDYLNPCRVETSLSPETVRECGGSIIRERRTIDPETRRVEKSIFICAKSGTGEEREYRESVRLYTLSEMNAMLAVAGLVLEGTAGSMEGAPFDGESERMVLWGKKGGGRSDEAEDPALLSFAPDSTRKINS